MPLTQEQKEYIGKLKTIQSPDAIAKRRLAFFVREMEKTMEEHDQARPTQQPVLMQKFLKLYNESCAYLVQEDTVSSTLASGNITDHSPELLKMHRAHSDQALLQTNEESHAALVETIEKKPARIKHNQFKHPHYIAEHVFSKEFDVTDLAHIEGNSDEEELEMEVADDGDDIDETTEENSPSHTPPKAATHKHIPSTSSLLFSSHIRNSSTSRKGSKALRVMHGSDEKCISEIETLKSLIARVRSIRSCYGKEEMSNRKKSTLTTLEEYADKADEALLTKDAGQIKIAFWILWDVVKVNAESAQLNHECPSRWKRFKNYLSSSNGIFPELITSILTDKIFKEFADECIKYIKTQDKKSLQTFFAWINVHFFKS